MTVSDATPGFRGGGVGLAAAVTSGLSLAREPRLLRAPFEEELRVLVHAQSVAVRECPSDLTPHPSALSFDGPGAPWARRRGWKPSSNLAEPVGEWQRRTLSVEEQVASLLMQLEHANGRWGPPRRADGAAPHPL
jgi:hypothetical protein